MKEVTRRFATTGMHCPSCSMLIEMDLAAMPGVKSVKSDHRSAVTEVVYDEETVGPDEIVAKVTRAGYGAEPIGD